MTKINHVKIKRPKKTDMFLFLAWTIKELSPDSQTKCGCVITDRNNRILGMGYNGLPNSLINENLPNVRPEKYAWMVHAEENAVANCQLKPKDAIAYITGYSCWNCTRHLYQNGITTIYEIDRKHISFTEEEQRLKQILVQEAAKAGKKFEIIHAIPDFSFSSKIHAEAIKLGFINTEMDIFKGEMKI